MNNNFDRFYKLWMNFWYRPVHSGAYAAIRIAYSITAIINLLELWPYRHSLFSEHGLVARNLQPTEFVLTYLPYSIDSGVVLTILFGIALIAHVLLALGLFTRWAALITFLWMCAYSFPNHRMFDGGDRLMRSIGFLIMISPVSTWSFDHYYKRINSVLAPIYGIRLFQLQLAVIYWAVFAHRLSDPFWLDGSALTYFLLSLYARWPQVAIADYGAVLAPVTYFALIIEGVLPLLLWSTKLRYVGLAFGLALHLTIAATSPLVVFSLAMLCLYPAFFAPRLITE